MSSDSVDIDFGGYRIPDGNTICRHYCSRKIQRRGKKIAEIQKKILEISSKESPYDIFICYKETDDLGNRTEDSSIAQDICTYLTNEGYKVFFSRITLRAHGGTEYEPYIFAALHSAKIMLVVGTKVEYLEAPWVKNEWGRFIAMMKEDKSKLLLPCYKYISPDALPDAFINCEALDIATPSFMLDLIKSIKKNLHKEDTRADNRNIEIHQMGGNAITLQKRADLFLEDGNFASAEEYYDKSLDQDPENSECYWGLIKCRLKCTSDEELVRLGHPLSEMEEYRNIFRFATSGQKKKYMDIDQKISNKIRDALDSIFQKKRQDLEILYVSYKRLRQNYKEYSQMGEEMFKRLEFLNTSINDYLNQLSPLLKHPLNNLLEQKQKSASLINNYMSDRKLLTKKDIQNACEASQNLVSAARINAEQIQKISREHPLFKSVDNLIRRRQELLNEIDQLMKDTQKNVSMLSNMQQQVKKINEKYEVLSKEVMAGDYINYNKMMQVS